MTMDWTALSDRLLLRCTFRCEYCWKPLGEEFHRHHRLLRKHGGKDEIENLLALHPYCHDVIHAHPSTSYRDGFLVRFAKKPGQTELLIRWSGARVMLTHDGEYRLTSASKGGDETAW